jgi:hypothetical protein
MCNCGNQLPGNALFAIIGVIAIIALAVVLGIGIFTLIV